MTEQRNVVLVCLDTVREDFFRNYATNLRSQADIEYRNCRAASSWSVPSHASMFTGELPHQHGIHTYRRSFAELAPADTFLANLNGYSTIAASANVWASHSFGFDGLFDSLSAVSPDRRFPAGLDVARFGQEHAELGPIRKQLAYLRAAINHENPLASLANGILVQLDDWSARLPIPKPLDDGASIITREAVRQMDSVEEPFFLFLNVMDAHGPLRHVFGYDRSLHDAPLSWSSDTVDWDTVIETDNDQQLQRYRGLYAAAIDYLDRRIIEFVDDVQAQTARETTVVITSDHGDNFATADDDGYWGHTDSSLSEGLLHVPQVVLNAPTTTTKTVDEYVSHLDLGDLLVGMAGASMPDVTRERIPAERIGHSGPLATVEQRRGSEADRLLRCVYHGDRKWLWDHEDDRHCYGINPDRPCRQSIIDEEVPVEELESTFFTVPAPEYKRHAAATLSEVAMDDVTRERLSELGYL